MKTKSDGNMETLCQNCGRELFGRTDKRFCNDSCRNGFNRRKKQQETQKANQAMPEILRIIKRNYEILLDLGPIEEDAEIYLELPNPRLKEFDFRFYTSIREYGNQRYHFCFERGWRIAENTCFIKDDFHQAKV